MSFEDKQMLTDGSGFAEQFVRARLGFNEFVKGARVTDANIADPYQEITDINVSGLWVPREFNSFTDIERAYDDMRNSLPADEPGRDMLVKKLGADSMMLRVLQGEDVNYDEFVSETAGFVPKEVPDSVIGELNYKLNALLDEIGLRHDAASVRDFEKQLLLTDSQAIEDRYIRYIATSRETVGKYVELPDTNVEPEFTGDDADILWTAWMSTDNHGMITLLVNTHPNRRYTIGKLISGAFHENGGHVIQTATWQEAIRSGKMSPALGLTAMASPENTYMEAVASFAETLITEAAETDEEKQAAAIQVVYDELYNAVTHNAYVRVNHGHREDGVIKDTVEALPFESSDRFKTAIVRSSRYPTYRAVLPSYRYVRELMGPVISSQDTDKRRSIMSALYSGSLTLDQVSQVIADNLETPDV